MLLKFENLETTLCKEVKYSFNGLHNCLIRSSSSFGVGFVESHSSVKFFSPSSRIGMLICVSISEVGRRDTMEQCGRQFVQILHNRSLFQESFPHTLVKQNSPTAGSRRLSFIGSDERLFVLFCSIFILLLRESDGSAILGRTLICFGVVVHFQVSRLIL